MMGVAMINEQARNLLASDAVRIRYYLHRCEKASYTLVMLHGLASNHTRWSEFLQHSRLPEQMNLLRMDLRGHGDSMTHQHYSQQHWLDDLHAVLQQEGLTNVIIAGHSLGAQVAMLYARQYPEHVKGLILVDPVLPRHLKGKLATAKRFRYLLVIMIKLVRFFYRLGIYQRQFPSRDMQQLDQQTRAVLASGSVTEIAKLYTNPLVDLEFMPLANYLQDLYEVVKPMKDLSALKCKVLLILSQGSAVMAGVDWKQVFNRETEIMVKCIEADHWPLTEKPQETREVVDEFCLNSFVEAKK